MGNGQSRALPDVTDSLPTKAAGPVAAAAPVVQAQEELFTSPAVHQLPQSSVAFAPLFSHCSFQSALSNTVPEPESTSGPSEPPPGEPQEDPTTTPESACSMPAPMPLPEPIPPIHPSAAAKKPLKRQVFISHTGQDEGAKTFAASILKPALEAAGLAVYMDFSNLELGGSWREELVDAAANSMVVVVVLSKTYSDRFWCMLELDLAMHAHAQEGGGAHGGGRPMVIPVFYDSVDVVIDTDKIQRHWSGYLQQQLTTITEPGSSDWVARVDVGRWVDNIVTMKGKVQHMRRRQPGQAPNKDEDWQLARGVVQAAARHMPSMVALGNVVGFEEQEAELAAQLGGRLGLWLYGQGGGGKSTMAKLLYNRLAGSFSSRAFVEMQVCDGADKTAQHLATALNGFGAMGEASEGAPVLSQRLQEFVADKKLLYILDNVWTASQLTALLPTQWGEGSVVIVTTRFESFPDSDSWPQLDEQLLQHKLQVLDEAASRQLFRQRAGLRGAPETALKEVEAAILAACGGLPLALRLMGGQLYKSKDEAVWKGALAALKQGTPGRDSERALEGVLSHSLVGMGEAAASMFLDVATILRGQPKELVLAVWIGWHGAAAAAFYEELVWRSLLDSDEEGMLVMHDVLIALGRGVVLQNKPRLEQHFGSRLWTQDGKVVGVAAAKGRRVLVAQLFRLDRFLNCEDKDEMEHRQQLLPKLDLSQARILQLGRLQYPPQKGVLWLEQYGAGAEWGQLSPGMVVLFAPDSQGAQPWEHLTALKQLNLRNCNKLKSLPESFGSMVALQELSFQLCEELTSLPESLGQLAALQDLNLHWCEQLRALPESVGKLTALQILNLSSCHQLTELPRSFCKLTALRQLDLMWCWHLAALPECFGKLAALQNLYLGGFRQLTALPESIGKLAALQTMTIMYCSQLTALPASFGKLAALQKLKLKGCSKLTALPMSFGQLAALQELDLSECTALRELSGSLVGLDALLMLDIRGCTSLVSLPPQREHSQTEIAMDELHLQLGVGSISGYFGDQSNHEDSTKVGANARQQVAALAPEGCWVSQWKVGWGEHGMPNYIQGVLNNGSMLPPLTWIDDYVNVYADKLCEDTVVGEAGGRFSALHGRAGHDGLHAFMGCGDLDGGEAWTFTCPPGHRIVGYGGSTRVEVESDDSDFKDSVNVEVTADDGTTSSMYGSVYVARVRFVTADFRGDL